ncbi:MAG: DUF1501 domain-containing protein [Acidobacteria bacterium]|nr:DUF1501 domain-containing protein [Acidobacteriota bacterium]
MDKHLLPDHSCEICKPLRPANSSLWGPHLGRRTFFKLAGTGVAGYFLVPAAMANSVPTQYSGAQLVGKARNVIFIQLQGAPSHIDTFDLKIGNWLPSDFNPTSYNGTLFPRGLMPNLADHLNKLTIIRSLRAPALVHNLQQIWTQISRNPTSIDGKTAPHIGSVVSLEFESERTPQQSLPGFVALNDGLLVGSGFLQSKYTPLSVPAISRGLPGTISPAGKAGFETRFQMLLDLDGNLRTDSPLGEDVADIDGFYQQAHTLMYNPQVDAVFTYRDDDSGRYGGTTFGLSLALARNLLSANLGTRFVQVNLDGWDNHTNIYTSIRQPAATLDRGLSALLTDLSAMPGVRGGTLLDETLIVAMGEFGRTVGSPGASLNAQNGRDHYFQHFAVLAGGGTRGGMVVGKTTDDGGAIMDPGWSQNRAVVNEDIAATIYSALGIDYTKILRDPATGRRFEYVPFASQGAWRPVLEVFSREPRFRPGTTPRAPRLNG